MTANRRELAELIDAEDPAWSLIQEWLVASRIPVEVLPAERARAEQALLSLQVTTHSVLGAIAFETGGILFDRGWLRILGSGHERLPGSLLTWNDHSDDELDSLKEALIVAHDAIGGFFAINGGAFSGPIGAIHYFAPDTLAWESLDRPYSEFLPWVTEGNLKFFYSGLRWSGWNGSMRGVTGDQGIALYPPLWATAEEPFPELQGRSRRVVPIQELWNVHRDLARQLAQLEGQARDASIGGSDE